MTFRATVLFLLSFIATAAMAQGMFLPPGDARLRDDLTLLVDAGALRLPLGTWPLPRADVARALAGVDAVALPDEATRAAHARVAAALSPDRDGASWRVREVRAAAGSAGLLRDFSTPLRAHGEFTVTSGLTTDRVNLTLAAGAARGGDDDQTLRLDGSDLSLRLGNWIFSANQLDRWWGPGHEGSLILSSNARPMPAVSLDRLHSLPLDVPVLRWLGPWRFSGFFGLGERHRPDVDQPVFLGMRLTFQPSRWLELGLSRSAQFCGKGRRCNLATFGRVLIGQDNVYLRGLDDPRDEPGNQMAGFDLRVASPLPALPLAAYAQLIGEDNTDSRIPMRYLRLFGAEGRWAEQGGAVWRAHVEFADTSVGWQKLFAPGTDPDTAYRQNIFSAGYRFRGRNIGHTTDADSATASVGLSRTSARGQRWAVLARHGRLDRFGTVDPFNPITAGPSEYDAVQLSWEGRIRRHQIGVRIGHERQSPASAGDARGMFGALHWRITP